MAPRLNPFCLRLNVNIVRAHTQTPVHTRARRHVCASTHTDTGSDATISCKDEAYYSRPYSIKKYKQKHYKSRCVYEKEQGRCSQSHIKERCRHTCTGVGGNSWSYSRPYKTTVYRERNWSSRCAYYKANGHCSQSWLKRTCRRTCTRHGSDSSSYSRPYKRRTAVVEREMKYSSKCAYIKDQGKCSPRLAHEAELCPKTCGLCTGNFPELLYLPAPPRKPIVSTPPVDPLPMLTCPNDEFGPCF